MQINRILPHKLHSRVNLSAAESQYRATNRYSLTSRTPCGPREAYLSSTHMYCFACLYCRVGSANEYIRAAGRLALHTDTLAHSGRSGGASGSPDSCLSSAMRLREGGYALYPAPLSHFLGILCRGPRMTVDGRIEVSDIATGPVAFARTLFPINLGLVLKSRLLNDFETVIAKELAEAR